jgi:hypothetical protein
VRKVQPLLGVTFAVWSLIYSTANAININLEYPVGSLFSATHDVAAKAAINAAAADLSAAITTSLTAIDSNVFVGTNGQTTMTFDWRFQYDDPSTQAEVDINDPVLAANAVTMFVGARSILGTTLGVGGPAGAGFGSSGSGFGGQWVGAVAGAESLSEAELRRGGGPVLNTFAGSSTLQGVTANYSIDVGIAYGTLSLDYDGNNNGERDTDAQLSNYWHFNHATPVAAGKNDLYSVALHEMLHALGIGASDAWTLKTSGTNWIGTEVTDLYGSGTNLVGGGHIASGIMSTSIVDGSPQEVVMDPSITQGSRKYLTALDLAFLRDIGYSTIIPDIPTFSPADFNEDGAVDASDLLAWQGGYGLNANGDTDDDGDTDGRDFLVWQREYTGPLLFSANVAVPEPGSAALVAFGLISWLCSRRRS